MQWKRALQIFMHSIEMFFPGTPTVWNSWDSVGKNVVSPQYEYICAF